MPLVYGVQKKKSCLHMKEALFALQTSSFCDVNKASF